MNKNRFPTLIVASFIILIVIGLDQFSKSLASDSLASSRPGVFQHSIQRVVEPSNNGKTIDDFVKASFGDYNSPDELQHIASSASINGSPSPRSSTVHSGDTVNFDWRKITVIPDYWDFQYTRNFGAAFSFLDDSNSALRTPFFITTSIIAALVILYLLSKVFLYQKLLFIGLSLICGGAIGNLIDRLLYGYVIDFIVWKYTDQYRWPTFNIADSAICVGIAFLIIYILFFEKSDKEREELELQSHNNNSVSET